MLTYKAQEEGEKTLKGGVSIRVNKASLFKHGQQLVTSVPLGRFLLSKWAKS